MILNEREISTAGGYYVRYVLANGQRAVAIEVLNELNAPQGVHKVGMGISSPRSLSG
jgi:hypothetical protein